MQRLTIEELRERSGEVAAAALRTPGLSAFCSGPIWQLAAHDFLHDAAGRCGHLIVEEAGNWLIFARRAGDGVCFPFESSWMFSSPALGDPERLAAMILDLPKHFPGPIALCLGGIRRDGPLHEAIRRIKPLLARYREFAVTESMVIDLEEGVGGWLGRRSPKFRRNLRSADKEDGIEIVEAGAGSTDDLFTRILAIQQQTYKWREHSDIFQSPGHAAFYRSLLKGLLGEGRLRLLFARRGGEDLAYILGGAAGDTYRGLQMSYREEVRSLGLGNRLQLENLRRCAAGGIVRYDLGMHSLYKDRWADRREENTGIFLVL